MTREKLADLLRLAQEAHHSTFGDTPDPDWADWYANYIVNVAADNVPCLVCEPSLYDVIVPR